MDTSSWVAISFLIFMVGFGKKLWGSLNLVIGERIAAIDKAFKKLNDDYHTAEKALVLAQRDYEVSHKQNEQKQLRHEEDLRNIKLKYVHELKIMEEMINQAIHNKSQEVMERFYADVINEVTDNVMKESYMKENHNFNNYVSKLS